MTNAAEEFAAGLKKIREGVEQCRSAIAADFDTVSQGIQSFAITDLQRAMREELDDNLREKLARALSEPHVLDVVRNVIRTNIEKLRPK